MIIAWLSQLGIVLHLQVGPVAVLQSDLAFSVFVLHVYFEKHQRRWNYFNLLERKDEGVLGLKVAYYSL